MYVLCMNACTCISVCMHVYVCMYACMHLCIYPRMCAVYPSIRERTPLLKKLLISAQCKCPNWLVALAHIHSLTQRLTHAFIRTIHSLTHPQLLKWGINSAVSSRENARLMPSTLAPKLAVYRPRAQLSSHKSDMFCLRATESNGGCITYCL